MQPILRNKKTLVAAALLMSMSNASMAGSNPFTISAQAIADVKISEITPLSFGTKVDGNAGSTCTLLSLEPADDDVNADIDSDGVAADTIGTGNAGSNWDAISGNCKTGGEASGVYEVAGEQGMTFNITLAAVVDTDFTFTPDYGCYVIWGDDTGTTAGDDSCGYLSTGTVSGIEINATGADTDADVNPGLSRFTVGGVLSITNDLTPNTSYNPTFDIIVAYD